MKYKVGDKVRIKSLDWYNENKDKYGIISFKVLGCSEPFFFFTRMSNFCDKVVKIVKVLNGSYEILEDMRRDGWTDEMIEGLVEEENKPKDMGEVSDGYHTFNELYEYRLLYNASMLNELAKQGLYDVHKSKRHSDGEIPFGDSNWFIVMAELPTGQISNHYEMKDWDLFQIPEKEKANVWDGHTPKDVAERIRKFLTPKPKYPQSYKECIEIIAEYTGSDCNPKGCMGYKSTLLTTFQKLLICRDAYWKIAGEEMRLGKPWEPDWDDGHQKKYIIYNDSGDIKKVDRFFTNAILAFPTEEMRDAFYENFKELINEVKELL